MKNCRICKEEYSGEDIYCEDCRRILDAMDGAYLIKIYKEKRIDFKKYKEVRSKIISRDEKSKKERKDKFLEKYDSIQN